MAQSPTRTDTDWSITRFVKEAYLSLFVLAFQISQWNGRMKESSASIFVSVVECALALSICSWIEAATHQLIVTNRWTAAAFFVLIAGPSDYFLVVRGRGVAFEKRFRGFQNRKKFVLYFAAIGIVVATGFAFHFSTAAYQQAFHITPAK